MSLNILIIGGVAGGMSAATRARRMNEHATITVIEAGGFSDKHPLGWKTQIVVMKRKPI